MAASPDRYALPARLLHWLTAAFVLPMIPVGFLLLALPEGRIQDTAFDLHRSSGAVVLLLVLLRLAYRARHPAPPLPADLPSWQQLASRTVHALLYLCLLANALVGWWGTSAYGAPISVFWLFELPPLTGKDEAAAKLALAIHGWIGIVLSVLIVLHVGAALWHRFVQRDGILGRML